MADYSYAQLEGLWINAGGPRDQAPLMAAIAEAESGGNSDARNPSGASGLWQILGNPFPGNPFDPATNARMAVAKYKSQGLGAWTTYTSGAYKAYLSDKTSPDSNVPGSPTATGAQSAAAQGADCLVGGQSILGLSLPCLFSKSNARAFLGAWFITASGLVGLAGVAVLAVGLGMKAAGPLGSAAEGVGGALMLVPGAEGFGAGIAAAGKGAKNLPQAGRDRVKRRDTKADKELGEEIAEKKKALGEPKENKDLEVGGGTVRETDEQKAARKRREAGAARARARRSVAPGGQPAPREETGF